MHSALNRLQNTFSSFTTYATILAALVATVSLLTTPVPNIPANALTLRNVQAVKGRPHYYTSKKEEYAHIKFDLDLDISSLFTWNTKQVFLYIVASYPPAKDDSAQGWSESIIWDAILKSPVQPAHHNQYVYPADKSARKAGKSSGARKGETPKTLPSDAAPGILKLSNQRPKYQITDPSGKIAGVPNATLSLHYNIQPWVGALIWGNPVARTPSTLGSPAKVVNKRVAEKLAAKEVQMGDWWMRLVPDSVKGLTWKTISGEGARSKAFDLPALKERKEAAKEAGGSLNVERGGERSKEEGFF